MFTAFFPTLRGFVGFAARQYCDDLTILLAQGQFHHHYIMNGFREMLYIEFNCKKV